VVLEIHEMDISWGVLRYRYSGKITGTQTVIRTESVLNTDRNYHIVTLPVRPE
jgi:hypothetical protein